MPPTSLFKWHHFAPEIIVCGVRWYLRYALSYRDIEEHLLERGLTSIILPCAAGARGMPLSSTSGVAAISPRQPTRTNHNHHGEYARHKAHPTQGFDDLLSHPLSLSVDCFGLLD